MGVLRSLSFWKKPKTTNVERFEPPRGDKEEPEPEATAAVQPPPQRLPQPVFDLTGDDEEEQLPNPAQPPRQSLQGLSSPSPPPRLAATPPPSPKGQSVAQSNAKAEASLGASLPAAAAKQPQTPPTRRLEALPVPIGASRRALSPLQEDNFPAGAGAQHEALNFDTPTEAVYAAIGEAFGTMIASSLQSSKWDKRVQALKAVTTMLQGMDIQKMSKPGSTGALGKGLRLRDRLTSWRLSCLLLNQSMRDKVMPVRLAALELFRDTFTKTEGAIPKEEVLHALNVLTEHILDRLGDSNLRLHEGARKCVFFCAEHRGLLGLGTVLAKLRARLGKAGKGGEKAKVHFGILDAVNFLLHHFPGRRSGERQDERCADEEDEEDFGTHSSEEFWTEEDVAPFVLAGMDDTLGARVRSSAITLAVTVYQTLGTEALRPLLAELRPAKQALLKQRFLESEGLDFVGGEDEEDFDEDDGEEIRNVDLDSLIVRGNAIKPPDLPVQPPLPGCVSTGYEEEFLMDGILEEAGMVFNGSGIINEGGRRGLRLPRAVLESQLDLSGLDLDEEDQQLLEQELMALGFADLEHFDEQQALLRSIQEEHEMSRRGTSVEVF